MNNKDFDEQEYLKQCLIRDMLRYKNRMNTYIDIVDSKNEEIKGLKQEIENLKYKCGKIEEEVEKKSETEFTLAKEEVKGAEKPKKVRCVDKGDYDCLTEGKEYDIVEDDSGPTFRIMSDDGYAYWYQKSRFEIVE